jgi:transposase
MKKLEDLIMILDLHRQGMKVTAIARQLGIDRKTVRKYIARGLEPPAYGPRQPRPRPIDAHVEYLRARLVCQRRRDSGPFEDQAIRRW